MTTVVIGKDTKKWTRPGTDQVRHYVTEEAKLRVLKLVVSRYNTGNISDAVMDGHKISNADASRYLEACAHVYWDGTRFTGFAVNSVSKQAQAIFRKVVIADPAQQADTEPARPTPTVDEPTDSTVADAGADRCDDEAIQQTTSAELMELCNASAYILTLLSGHGELLLHVVGDVRARDAVAALFHDAWAFRAGDAQPRDPGQRSTNVTWAVRDTTETIAPARPVPGYATQTLTIQRVPATN